MKYIFTAMIVLTFSFSKGQTVTIPDANFKISLLNQGIDLNNDGEIQITEALAVTSIATTGNNISDLTGIRSFSNLQYLTCWNNQLTTLDVSGLSQLTQLICDNNLISTINLSGCDNLTFLACTQNRLARLEVSNLNNLVTLVCLENPLLTVIDAHSAARLKSVDCSGGNNSLMNVILTDCDSLITVSCYDSHIENVNISGSKKIQRFNDFGLINNLIARNCTGLQIISTTMIAGIGVGNFLDVTGCTNLETIFLQESGLLTLDLSSCINLKNLGLPHNNYNFQYLNIKNGSSLTTLDLGDVNGIPNLVPLKICADDFETSSVNSSLVNYGKPYSVSSYCSFYPGGNYNIITGKTRLDITNNGCDNNDAGMPNVALRITDTSGNSLVRFTTQSGDYAHYPYKGLFTLTPYFPYPYFTVNPSSATVSFDTANHLLNTTNFCIQPNGAHNDLEITFLPAWPPARPGLDAGYTLVYKNRGTTTLSGSVQVNFDNSKMNFTTASPNTTSQSTGQLSWNYNNLQPFESRTIYVTFSLLPPPVNNIGDTIIYLAAINPSANDETAFDNSFILPQRVIGSFDPNDKQCLEGSKLDISKIGDYLHYQIHFQNEGTDTAFNIVVADTLSDKLDWNSFELISSSHPVDVKLNNNKAEFIFENIKLPYKAINEPASNGWVAFKIKPKPSVVIGDSLNNKAAIYFDFNKPVITNTATTIVSSASTPVPVKLEYFSVNSNNNTNILNWKAACSYGSAKFTIERSDDAIHFSNIGYITATSTRCQLPFNFTDNNPAAGKNYYRLKITDADGISFYSKILMTGNNKAGITITSVAGNTVYLNSNKQQSIQLKIIAADGKEILTERKMIVAGNNNISLQMKNVAKGIYTFIMYNNEGVTIIKRFLK